MNKLQLQVSQFNLENQLTADALLRALDLSSEVGEVCKLAFSTGVGKKVTTEQWQEELGDALYSILSLMNVLGIEADQALLLVLKKYEKRIKQNGTADSGD
ncbi:MAG: MazG nucleotide pyrophosphohydrolase domain-containing protein [Pseudobdellovibrionaceae bacterium]